MKNLIIGLLAIAVIGLGGWVAYGSIADNGSTSSSDTAGDQEPTGKIVDLSGKGLTAVGADIYDKTDTTSLILSRNNLTSLPSEMGRMTNLQELRLDRNDLEGSLIGEIRHMPLKTLDVSYNDMTGMPAEIGQLKSLVTLDYSYNKLTGLPNELVNLKNTLREFDLTGNPLSQDSIDKIKADLPDTVIVY